MRVLPEKEKVLVEKKVDGKGVRDCMFSLSEKEKENEKTERCRPKRKFLAAPLLSSTNPEPDDTPPRTLGDARKCKFWNGFEKAIESELTQLEKNNTWEYIDRNSLPSNTNILRAKFVFDFKKGGEEEFLKYKARMVACGRS